jgi:hypothetical protein
MFFTLVVSVSAIAFAGDLLTMEITSAQFNYDQSLDYMLANGSSPTITRDYPYETYFAEAQYIKMVVQYGGGGLEVYDLLNNREYKQFGYIIGSPLLGGWAIVIYFDKIPEGLIARIRKPIEYKSYN